MKALVIAETGELLDFDLPDNETACAEKIHEILGGDLQFLPFPRLPQFTGAVAFINDEGKFRGMAPNLLATRLMMPGQHIAHDDFIVGPMVILGHRGSVEIDAPEVTVAYISYPGSLFNELVARQRVVGYTHPMSAHTNLNLAEYFGTDERPSIYEAYSLAEGWQYADSCGPVTHANLLELAGLGCTKVSLKLGTRIADFSIAELTPVGISAHSPLEGLRNV